MLNILKELNNIKSRLDELESIPAIEKDILLEQIRELYKMVLEVEDTGDDKVLKDEDEAGKQDSIEDQEAAPEPGKKDESLPPEKKPLQQKDKKPSPEILAEKYRDGKSFINERLAQKNGKEDLSSKLQSKPIKDIAAAIGINDKYKLIRDLFKGNPDIFEETIIQLNQASNFNEAYKYITSNFDWEMEDESVLLLLDLVRRKFIVDKNG